MRIFEHGALGVAPVILADEFVEPAGRPTGEAFSLRVRGRDLGSLETILQAHSGRLRGDGRSRLRSLEAAFHPDLLSELLRRMPVLGCHPGQRGIKFARASIERWRSRRMYKANGWTAPQRLSNKLKQPLAWSD